MTLDDLSLPPTGESSASVAVRVAAARAVQASRYDGIAGVRVNAEAPPALLDRIAAPDAEGQALLRRAAERIGLTARGYYRVLRTARTIADMAGAANVQRDHLAEAISYRLPFFGS